MRLLLTIIVAGLAIQPVAAHPGEHAPAAAKPAAVKQSQMSDEAAVKQVLSQYQAAIERLDATGTERLFAADSAVFETGGAEGTYANYLAHHLGPELKEFKSFSFSDYKADVRFEGPIAVASESYKYRIETKDGTVAERLGVSTSVLKKIDGQWKILVSHNSARKPKGS